MKDDEMDDLPTILATEIDRCIAILEQLVANTDVIFDTPMEKRTALIKQGIRI